MQKNQEHELEHVCSLAQADTSIAARGANLEEDIRDSKQIRSLYQIGNLRFYSIIIVL
jgi:hypothetical protein